MSNEGVKEHRHILALSTYHSAADVPRGSIRDPGLRELPNISHAMCSSDSYNEISQAVVRKKKVAAV